MSDFLIQNQSLVLTPSSLCACSRCVTFCFKPEDLSHVVIAARLQDVRDLLLLNLKTCAHAVIVVHLQEVPLSALNPQTGTHAVIMVNPQEVCDFLLQLCIPLLTLSSRRVCRRCVTF